MEQRTLISNAADIFRNKYICFEGRAGRKSSGTFSCSTSSSPSFWGLWTPLSACGFWEGCTVLRFFFRVSV